MKIGIEYFEGITLMNFYEEIEVDDINNLYVVEIPDDIPDAEFDEKVKRLEKAVKVHLSTWVGDAVSGQGISFFLCEGDIKKFPEDLKPAGKLKTREMRERELQKEEIIAIKEKIKKIPFSEIIEKALKNFKEGKYWVVVLYDIEQDKIIVKRKEYPTCRAIDEEGNPKFIILFKLTKERDVEFKIDWKYIDSQLIKKFGEPEPEDCPFEIVSIVIEKKVKENDTY